MAITTQIPSVRKIPAEQQALRDSFIDQEKINKSLLLKIEALEERIITLENNM